MSFEVQNSISHTLNRSHIISWLIKSHIYEDGSIINCKQVYLDLMFEYDKVNNVVYL